jgi:hypothetical protein
MVGGRLFLFATATALINAEVIKPINPKTEILFYALVGAERSTLDSSVEYIGAERGIAWYKSVECIGAERGIAWYKSVERVGAEHKCESGFSKIYVIPAELLRLVSVNV